MDEAEESGYGERRLLGAVLLCALEDLRGCDLNERADARRFLLSEDGILIGTTLSKVTRAQWVAYVMQENRPRQKRIRLSPNPLPPQKTGTRG